ncbi:MAG: hypothetical protein EAZ30_02645 [Betaproteobacteria bacterium]|nr:MAG: hypothetical protein EAZ30_02645 [Betaproteobacteria bacterium]
MFSPCYQLADIKAFKGKGAAHAAQRWVREAQTRLDAVYQEMEALKTRTRSVAGRSFAIEVYRRNRAGDVTVRWRWISGEHCTWEAVAPEVAQMPRVLREFYTEINIEMHTLNAVEASIRCECRRAINLIDLINGPGGRIS